MSHPCPSLQRLIYKNDISLTTANIMNFIYSRWEMKSRYGIPHTLVKYCYLLQLNVSKQTAYESIQMKPGAVKAEPHTLCCHRVFYGRTPPFHPDSPFIHGNRLSAYRGNEAPQQKHTQTTAADILCTSACAHVTNTAHADGCTFSVKQQ